MKDGVKDTGLAVLAFARHKTLALLEDIPQNELLHQPVPGGNHALWILGHLAGTDDQILTGLVPRASNLPESWPMQFGQGSTPIARASAYPGLTAIKDRLAAMRAELERWFASLSDDTLRSPLPDDWKPFAPTYGALMSSIAWHEGLHAGQLTVIRRSLGIAPKFG